MANTENLNCPICGTHYDSRQSLDQHTREEHSDQRMQADDRGAGDRDNTDRNSGGRNSGDRGRDRPAGSSVSEGEMGNDPGHS